MPSDTKDATGDEIITTFIIAIDYNIMLPFDCASELCPGPSSEAQCLWW